MTPQEVTSAAVERDAANPKTLALVGEADRGGGLASSAAVDEAARVKPLLDPADPLSTHLRSLCLRSIHALGHPTRAAVLKRVVASSRKQMGDLDLGEVTLDAKVTTGREIAIATWSLRSRWSLRFLDL